MVFNTRKLKENANEEFTQLPNQTTQYTLCC